MGGEESQRDASWWLIVSWVLLLVLFALTVVLFAYAFVIPCGWNLKWCLFFYGCGCSVCGGHGSDPKIKSDKAYGNAKSANTDANNVANNQQPTPEIGHTKRKYWIHHDSVMHVPSRHAQLRSKSLSPLHVLQGAVSKDHVFSNHTPSVSNAKSVFFPKTDINVLQIFIGFGVNYYSDARNYLPTCVNDMKAGRRWWFQNAVQTNPSGIKLGWKQREFHVTDDRGALEYVPGAPPIIRRIPTLENWRNTLNDVLQLARQQHSVGGKTEIMLMSSSHGSFQKSMRDDELDGSSECIVCLDGFYWDHQFMSEFLAFLPASVHMLSIFDSCNSGTVMNLPWMYNRLSRSCNQMSRAISLEASVWCFSGSMDSETSAAGADASDLSVLTKHMLQTVMSPSALSNPIIVGYLKLLGNLRQRSESQTPLLSVSHTSLVDPMIRLFG